MLALLCVCVCVCVCVCDTGQEAGIDGGGREKGQ